MESNFWVFSKAGRDLASWHLNYETVEPYPLQQHSDQLDLGSKDVFKVEKMRFGKKGKDVDKTMLDYNRHISLSGIPLKVYDYIVNGRSALEWIIDQYQFSRDTKGGSLIENDPNEWSEDPQYILNLVKRVVRVSLETVKIVEGLPALKEGK